MILNTDFATPPGMNEWSESTMDVQGNIECPRCHSLVSRDSVDKHTLWHVNLWAAFDRIAQLTT